MALQYPISFFLPSIAAGYSPTPYLDKQYNRPLAWVIANMGKTNDLGLIHRNLRESLQH